MSRSSEQKIRLLVLYDILRKESDEDSPLSTNELIEKLSQYGIAATRQTVYDDIEMLNTFGYEIIAILSAIESLNCRKCRFCYMLLAQQSF